MIIFKIQQTNGADVDTAIHQRCQAGFEAEHITRAICDFISAQRKFEFEICAMRNASLSFSAR